MGMVRVTESGTRLQQLKELARVIAEWMDDCDSSRDMASLARQYRETIKEIEQIGGADDSDGLAEIIGRRKG